MTLWTRLFRPNAYKADLEAEIQSHLSMAAAEKQARGAEAGEAQQEARKEFGNVALVKDVTRGLDDWIWLEWLAQDFRFAIRQLLRNPTYSVAVILTLALGIGVNSAVFSMVDGFMLRPLPYPGADRMASLILHREGPSSHGGQLLLDDSDSHTFETWNLIRHNIPAVQAAAQGSTTGVNLQVGPLPGANIRYVHASRVSSAYFDVLGVRLLMGRGFSEQEDLPGGPKVAVLGYGLWQSVFGGDRQVSGKAITLKGEPYTVVGVLAEGTQSPGHGELFTALAPGDPKGECGGDNCSILLRLRAGRGWQEANGQIARLRLPSFDEIAHENHGRAWFYAQPLSQYLGSQYRAPVLALMLAVGFILFIACANLAGLMLVRMERRQREIATRLALGARRNAILRQLWVESLLLALMGASAGTVLAAGILGSLRGFVPEEFLPLGGLSIDLRVLAFTLGASIFTSILFGALPAYRASRVDVRGSITAGSYAVARGTSRFRQALIAVEVAITVVLLCCSGLLIRTLIHLETLPPGFEARNVMTAKLSLDDARYHDAAAFRLLLTRSLAAMRQIPGVEDAAVGLSVPYERGLNDGVRIMDGPKSGAENASSLAWITTRYFETLGIPFLAGRSFYESDTFASEDVAIVNTAFGRKFYDDPNPIGRHFATGKSTFRIAGVVGDVAKRPGVYPEAPLATEPVAYIPAAQTDSRLILMGSLWFEPSWIVRTHGPIQSISASMQSALSQADPTLPFSGFYAMSDLLAESLLYQRIEVTLLGSLAGLALLLSAIGVYGLVSNLVGQRTREIGIRIALGSALGDAMVTVGSAGVIATAYGVVAGLLLSLLATRLLHSQLYGVGEHDPMILIAVPIVLMGVALAASALPALRIARIQPADTLRME